MCTFHVIQMQSIQMQSHCMQGLTDLLISLIASQLRPRSCLELDDVSLVLTQYLILIYMFVVLMH